MRTYTKGQWAVAAGITGATLYYGFGKGHTWAKWVGAFFLVNTVLALDKVT